MKLMTRKKSLGQSISESEGAIEEIKGSTAKLTEDIAALGAGLKEVGKAVVETAEQTKERRPCRLQGSRCE